MRPFVVFNPGAGGAVREDRLRRALSRLPGAELVITRAPGDASALAAEAVSQGYDTIVAAGGDGLVGEVVNGLAPDFARARLGVVALGTGNDFARGLGLPLKTAAAVELIRAGETRLVDVAKLRLPGSAGSPLPPRWFVNALVAGLPGRIARRTSRAGKRRWGALAYRTAAMPELIRARPVEIELELHDGPGMAGERLCVDAYGVIVAIGPYAGGGVCVAPAASQVDGLLHVVLSPDMGRVALTLVAVRLMLGGGDGGRLLRRRARRIRLRVREGACFNVDGEDLPGTEAVVELVPRLLRVLSVAPSPVGTR